MKIEKPIFIVGVGRSGSTVFHRMFCKHPSVAWISARLSDRHPQKPHLNGRLMRVVDWPLVGGLFEKRYSPGEGYDFWEHHCKGFSTPCRDLEKQDVTHRIKQVIPQVLSQTLTRKRNRLLVKITGWPRMRFLQEIFPDAKFIHVERDPRGVVNSMLNVDWWWGWRGPQNWRWGELTAAQEAEWRQFNRSFVALACIELEILQKAMVEARKAVPPENFHTLRYESLCERPLDTFKEVAEFSELEWSPGFERSVKNHPLRNQNEKWSRELTEEQQQILEHFFGAKRAEPKPSSATTRELSPDR